MSENWVAFVFSDWGQVYPELVPAVTEVVAENLFAQAEILLDNMGCSEVVDLTQRRVLLWLLVAHLAVLKLNAVSPGVDGEGKTSVTPGVVGRIASATEGSVSVSSDGLGATSPNAAWYQQTQYGATFWQMIQSLFHFEYIPPPSNAFRRLP
ncbi:DUF4054 domain-containing protein [Entomobacter blattae]|uniref:DUF4054 domain-containing protein n=1 Tax=Entomobacter blattae TaxID=2762277 RepID=A0A7H1NU52_9PROT|nr:DUF4054 domain-containing protein [Entomobacter blattae]QNT79312.1 hypothetical protein JGUZn3_21090 [Entomobacter blattae]